jgi:hypothetical protein
VTLLAAKEKANTRLNELGIEPIGHATLHGLRRTSASLRCAAGDDVAYTAEQLGHEDATFTLRVYTAAVKRQGRLRGAELAEFKRAVEWARWAAAVPDDPAVLAQNGTNAPVTRIPVAGAVNAETQKAAG